MLDLGVYAIQSFKLKLPDGTILNIDEPTVRLKLKLADIIKNMKDMSVDEQENELANVCVIILNNNFNKKSYNLNYVKKYLTQKMQLAILYGYSDFINGIYKQKN